MNSKKRYIPIIALGALILSLLAILPVSAADEVEFIDPTQIDDSNDGSLSGSDPTPDEQEWARQGGLVGVRLVDSDVAVRRVLLPGVDTNLVSSGGTIVKNSRVISLGVGLQDEEDGERGLQFELVKRDDLIMVGYETLRKVTKVETVDVDENNDVGDEDYKSDADAAAEVVIPNSWTATSSTWVIAQNMPGAGDYSSESSRADAEQAARDAAVAAEITRTSADDEVKVTLDRPYHLDAEGADSVPVHVVKREYYTGTKGRESQYNAFDGDGYKTLASGLKFSDSPEVSLNHDSGTNTTTVRLDRDVVDSGVGSHTYTGIDGDADAFLGLRLRSAKGRGVRDDDVYIAQVTSAGAVHSETYPVASTAVNVAQGVIPLQTGSGDRTMNEHLNAYVLFWASEETDMDMTARSQAYQSPMYVVAKETNTDTGQFAAKIELIPAQVSTSWANIPAGDAGAVVTLTDDADADVGYADLMVEVPASRPTGTITAETPIPTIQTVADSSQTIPRLPVNPRDVVNVRSGASSDIRVETTPSVFSALSPAHNTSARDDRPELSAQVIDGDSGLAKDKIEFVYRVDDAAPVALVPDDSGDTEEISGGFSVRDRVLRVDDTDDRVIEWWVKATDKAGNVTFSDRQPTKDGNPDRCSVTIGDTDEETNNNAVDVANSKCQPYIIMVDNSAPSMARAETGRWWDTSLSTGDSDDKTEYRASKARNTSVLVVFNEHLDPATVQANDFEVNDATPTSADVFNVTVRDDDFQTYEETGVDHPEGDDGDLTDEDPDTGDGNSAIAGDSVQEVGQKKGYVFLTVNALVPNARPKVELVDNVEDIAGNRRNSGTITSATDRIAPSLTVAVREGDRPVTNKDVTLTVTSNEDVGTPTVRYRLVDSTSPEDGDSVQTVAAARTDAVVTFKSAKEYEVKITPTSDGLYTVFVTANDSSGGNAGTKGDETVDIDVDSDTTAILFERDKNLSAPDFDPDKSGVNNSFETDDSNGFVRIDYSAEGKEYSMTNVAVSATATPPVTEARSGDDLDTHGRITIVSATFDGNDITGALNANSAGNIFQYHLGGVAVGEYDLELTVRDEAGNTNAAAHKGTIKVIERKPYKLTLNPGWNLVSLPGQPADTDINAVIPADHPIDAVRGYDPMVPGAWLIAEEGGDGTFSGTLETIEAGTAYWIKSTSFESLDVNIPKPTPGSLTLLPTISISQGWNLVPILDVDGDFELAEQTATDNYFSGLTTGSIAAIYTYNTVTNSWMAVEEDGVALGKGYWVYATKPGVIVP